MNLKEAFHYQTFLNSLMEIATVRVGRTGNALRITKRHLRSKANPEAQDFEEIVEPEGYVPVTAYIAFMQTAIEAKQALTEAISNAKSALDFDMDAAVESNKFRQSANSALKRVIQGNKPYERTERDSDYKFNAEGNQTPYYYEVEVVAEEMFDKPEVRSVAKDLISEANELSAKIDSAMVNTIVDYAPAFDVNDSFDDIIAEVAAEISDE